MPLILPKLMLRSVPTLQHTTDVAQPALPLSSQSSIEIYPSCRPLGHTPVQSDMSKVLPRSIEEHRLIASQANLKVGTILLDHLSINH